MKKVLAALLPKGTSIKARRNVVVVLDECMKDAREEMFVVMICDGLSMRLAFARAGFESKDVSAPAKLFNLPRIQERVNKVLEARRTTGVLSLAEVTDMLKRVYAGAQSAEEYSAAHNAAFSLARLYGHVTDRATVEIIRRPSRDPDAPSEQALSSWVESLPSLTIDADPLLRAGSSSADQGQISAPHGAPAALLGPRVSGPAMQPADAAPLYTPSVNRAELSNDIKGDQWIENPEIDWLGPGEGRAETGNGAPPRPVTGTPAARGRSDLLGDQCGGSPLLENGSPSENKQVPVKIREKVAIEGGPMSPNVNREKVAIPGFPSFEELFG